MAQAIWWKTLYGGSYGSAWVSQSHIVEISQTKISQTIHLQDLRPIQKLRICYAFRRPVLEKVLLRSFEIGRTSDTNYMIVRYFQIAVSNLDLESP